MEKCLFFNNFTFHYSYIHYFFYLILYFTFILLYYLLYSRLKATEALFVIASAPSTPLKISLPKNKTMVKCLFRCNYAFTRRFDSYSITNKALVAFWCEFHFKMRYSSSRRSYCNVLISPRGWLKYFSFWFRYARHTILNVLIVLMGHLWNFVVKLSSFSRQNGKQPPGIKLCADIILHSGRSKKVK